MDALSLALIASKRMATLLAKKGKAEEFLNIEVEDVSEKNMFVSKYLRFSFDRKLSSALQCGQREKLYFHSTPQGTTHLDSDVEEGGAEEPSDKLAAMEKLTEVPPLHLSRGMKKSAKRKEKEIHDTAGEKWFDLPATPITPELKKDLRLLQMRGALDTKRFYKSNDLKSLPKYFQVRLP